MAVIVNIFMRWRKYGSRYHAVNSNPCTATMKNTLKLPAFLLLAGVAMSLAACGGSGAVASIGGTVVGLSGGTSVVLLNNATDPITVSANGSFTFDQQIDSGAAYSITVETQPIGESCTVTNGSGTVDTAGDSVTNVVVSCYATGS